MKTELTITTAGRAALAAVGPDAIEISSIAVGAAPRIVADIAGTTALQSEIARTEFFGDAGSSPGSIAGYGLFEESAAWSALEIGVYATVGNSGEILFAYALAVNNSSGIRVPLLTKTADETARYDFAFIFPLATAAVPSSSPCSVPLTVSCFAPMYHPVPPSPSPSPAPPPVAQQVWRSVNARAPHADDVAFPVGHLWMYDKDEWVLESKTAGTAQWRQTRGSVLIYDSHSGVERGEYNLSGDFSFTDFTAYEFIAVSGWRAHSTAPAFLANPVKIGFAMYAASATRGEELTISRIDGNDSRFWLSVTRQAAPPDIKLKRIYGIY